MADNLAATHLRSLVQNLEIFIKQLDCKDAMYLVKKTKEIEGCYERTASIVKITKSLLKSSVEEVIFKNNNNE